MSLENLGGEPRNPYDSITFKVTGSPGAMDEVLRLVDVIAGLVGVESLKIDGEIEPKELTVEDFPDLNPDRFEVIYVDGNYKPVVTRNKLLEYSGIFSDNNHAKKSGDKGNGTRLWFLLQKAVNRNRVDSTDYVSTRINRALVTSEDGVFHGIDPYKIGFLVDRDIKALTEISTQRAKLLEELSSDLFI